MTHLIAGLAAPAPPAVTGSASVPENRNNAAPANGASFTDALHAAQDERPPDAAQNDAAQDDAAQDNAVSGDPPTEAELAALAALLLPMMAPAPELMVDTVTIEGTALTATEHAAPQTSALPDNALALAQAAPQTNAAPAVETAEAQFVLPDAELEAAPTVIPTQLTPTPPTESNTQPERFDAKAATDRPPLQRAATASDPPLGPPFSVMVTERVITTPFNELARLSETRPTEVLPQIQRGVESLVHSGQTSLRLQLHPEHLGRIDLQLTASADGVRVSIVADQSHTGQLLERHLADLRQTLADSGIAIAGMSVGLNAQHGQAFTLANWQKPAVGGPLGGATLAADSAPEAEAIQRAPRLDLGFLVDYSI